MTNYILIIIITAKVTCIVTFLNKQEEIYIKKLKPRETLQTLIKWLSLPQLFTVTHDDIIITETKKNLTLFAWDKPFYFGKLIKLLNLYQ